ncbi:MAG TPA: outer membrane lipoprotein carrier protein LolA [Sphingobacterium sp.]|nr:outer membrane lipoprotein carrier protein LolA [Sphingobacterium sp.]
MKSILKISLIALLVFHGKAYTQVDESAEKILQQVSEKYDAYKTLQSNFTFLAEFAEEGNQRDKGIMYLDKTRDSYQINLESQKIISDGKAVWSILPEDKEVQITNPVSDEESIGPNNIFTFYQKGYKYITMEDEFTQDNKRLKVIELSPENTQQNYFKIKLRINDNLHIHDVKIFDKSGARYTYTISNLYVNHKINRKKFTFQKEEFPDYEIVDLR